MVQEALQDTQKMAVYRRSFQARIQHQYAKLEDRRKKASEAVLAVAPGIIAKYSSVQRAYLFGSIIQPGTFHPESDVDIAIEGVTAQAYFALWRALEETLPEWAIDLRDITQPSPFADLVRQTGVLIYERKNPTAAS